MLCNSANFLRAICYSRATSEPNPPRKSIPEHHPVAHERPQRVLEGGRAVLFEDEVADPGEAVAGEGQGDEPQQVAAGDGVGEDRQHQQAAHVVQAAAGGVAVFLQVEGVELGEAVETLGGVGGHGAPPVVVMAAVYEGGR